ncbi:hypothetical protein N656DRAFT_481226 [Canariomyces notabilis]|uniref:Uncharacterized protein n=1 Tax=Canariomyces notabilis TaxID=2074819 RepID=A0AAN6YW28_9PEZI|nr:hypothetical protein N656DRAFT_481226 [Canariomyces arenarius]
MGRTSGPLVRYSEFDGAENLGVADLLVSHSSASLNAAFPTFSSGFEEAHNFFGPWAVGSWNLGHFAEFGGSETLRLALEWRALIGQKARKRDRDTNNRFQWIPFDKQKRDEPRQRCLPASPSHRSVANQACPVQSLPTMLDLGDVCAEWQF